ncbi:universal stress protein [Mycolicibacterium sp. BiH015]|uniref:universal stress protein n=1 Tax=Mycolicibacterium sp. BiH015 TaxID=3018808 RepID=UPI0022E0EDA3|nr:universal stress protein [Mycolicibacterium sp. BiH015]MDA2891234.1 universal stress protein [Mycolicibacterium sp. BiH015]
MSESTAELGIVVGVDGSPESHAAVRWAAQEAVLRRRPVTLLHVVSPIVVTWPIEPVVTGFYEWQEDNATEVLKQSQETLYSAAEGSPPPEVHLELRHDGILTELSNASKSADMIVVGSRGLGPVGGAVLGSVSRALLHHAQCPVVVAREGVVRRTDRNLPVLLGIDGSPASAAATAFAFEEASRRGVDLVALHAWSDVAVFPILGMDWHTYEQQGHEVLGERLAGWQEAYPDVRISRRIVCDKPARWLIDESKHAQLVVVGSRGRGGISSMLFGSVSTAVAESATTPVAVVRS